MTKTIQFRVSKEEIDDSVKKHINRRIQEICKEQKVDDQIRFEIDQAVIEVRVVNYEERIKMLEDAVYGKGPKGKI